MDRATGPAFAARRRRRVYGLADLVPNLVPNLVTVPIAAKETVVRPSRLVLAALFALVGLVWIGQGVGLIGGSMMTGSAFWAVMGVVLLVVAVLILVIERRRPAKG
jgi:hypothetical protein